MEAGDRVTVRGARWVVDEATPFGDCTLLRLTPADSHDTHLGCQVLLPFDRPVRCADAASTRATTRRRWMKQLHARLADLRVSGQLRAAGRASFDILPFQLEPALALITGRASRFLLADEVGLGKTIQAGLMIAELQQRGWCECALILTPAGLRAQWADELSRRFAIRAAIIDAATLWTLARSLPPDVNPWAVHPVCIASLDFVKQPAVLEGLRGQITDILIVDEVHQASTASLRYEAVKALARRSRHVVLLTATPHPGDDAAYRALCDLGRIDRADPILLFRRTRQQAGLPRTRRVHLLPVRQTPYAREMHRQLNAYVARLWQIARATGRSDLQLAAMVLSKRGFSSAHSLAASVERRLAGVSGLVPAPSQWDLPFDLEAVPADETPHALAPAFDRLNEEQTALRRLLDAARLAQQDEPKERALRRLLRRVQEPVIVFTEYRDTLQALGSAVGNARKAVALHGGQTSEQRRQTVEAFARGSADLLLATDAGAEGLNLHGRCRMVVNLELPWNPMRLEQRIGRVDRIGQRRTVHVINLFADGTAEHTVLARLLRRVERISASEIDIAASIITSAPIPVRLPGSGSEGCTDHVDLTAAARAEAARLGPARPLTQARPCPSEDRIPVTTIKSAARAAIVRHAFPAHTPRCFTVWFVRVRIGNGAGRLVEDTLVPVAVPMVSRGGMQAARVVGRREVRATSERMIQEVGRDVVAFVSHLAEVRARTIEEDSADWVRRALRRERHLAEALSAGAAPLIQAGLFESRGLLRHQAAGRQQGRDAGESARRRALLEAASTAVQVHEPQVALLLLAC